jgi:hypothetical protein|tara:strand:- start:2930 stop:3778 length:849 start_codon:yes stop_codon:yes gene_type:complete
MEYRLHTNGWTPIVEKFDLRNATYNDVELISNLIYKYTTIVIKKQDIDIPTQLRVIKMFNNPTSLYENDNEYVVPNTDGVLLKVGGSGGISDHVGQMDWHHDFHWQLKYKPSLIWLHGIRDVIGSTTTYTNNILAYQRMPNGIKKELESLHAVLMKSQDFDVDTFKQDPDGTYWPPGEIVNDYKAKVVRMNQTGNKYMYFPFNQIHHFEGMTREESKEIILEVKKYITDPAYLYVHKWDTGDIVISDQWSGLHKRDKCEFIESRRIYRALFDYVNQEHRTGQ